MRDKQDKLDEQYFIAEEMLTEKTMVSFHKRTPTQMATLHKSILQRHGHTITSHETTGNGSHVIHHITPEKKLRVSTISPVHDRKSYNAKIHDRPGTAEEHNTYGVKK